MFQLMIQGSLEDVWHEITRTDQVIPAFFNTRMDRGELKPGSKLAMRTQNGKYTGVVGEIVEVVPLKRFAHTFKFTNFDDPECLVIFDLEPKDGGVLFTMTLENLPEGTRTAKQMVSGAKLITATLKSVIETGRPSFGTRLLFVLFRVMEPISPKRCRSENWPVNTPKAPK
jgi:uncharacterized protein YndB with AHSA1/START domain